MGSGKTSVSKALSALSGFTLLDTDQKIEELENTTITQLFNTKGEEYFRKLEESLCESLLVTKNSIISTGGGMILSEKNQELLEKIGVIIYLEASVETIVSRIKNETKRPLFSQKTPLNSLSILLQKREPIYKKLSDLTVSTNDKTVEEIAQKIWDFYNSNSVDQKGRKVLHHESNAN
jgi:shikimate kinase